MKALTAIGVLIVLVVGGLLLRYGAITPCGIVKEEMKRSAMREAMKEEAGDDALASVMRGLGVTLASPAVDAYVDGLSTTECFRLLTQDTGWKN